MEKIIERALLLDNLRKDSFRRGLGSKKKRLWKGGVEGIRENKSREEEEGRHKVNCRGKGSALN